MMTAVAANTTRLKKAACFESNQTAIAVNVEYSRINNINTVKVIDVQSAGPDLVQTYSAASPEVFIKEFNEDGEDLALINIVSISDELLVNRVLFCALN